MSNWRDYPCQNFASKRRARKVNRLHFNLTDPAVCVCHHCDNPLCIEPLHLFLGSQQDNVNDAVRKGRMRGNANFRGSQRPQAKLKEKDIPKIRILLNEGYSQYEIAKLYGVSRSAILQIHLGKAWTHI